MYFNKNFYGNAFNSATVELVWQKGIIITGYDPNVYRKDTCGAWMRKDAYGNTNSDYGWEIDHIRPKSRGGTDELSNLQPLQWENNRHKGDDYPQWSCKIRA